MRELLVCEEGAGSEKEHSVHYLPLAGFHSTQAIFSIGVLRGDSRPSFSTPDHTGAAGMGYQGR